VRDLIDYVVRALVERPEEVSITEKPGERMTTFELSVHPDDRGRVIGKSGQTIHALRSIVAAAATVQGINATVDVAE
jgi:predicted RNA-binding protein YlqC (UPF0109 family)